MRYFLLLMCCIPYVVFAQNPSKEYTFYFEKNDYNIPLDTLKKIKLTNIHSIDVYAFSDTLGTEEYNLTLSKKRADAIVEKLKILDIDSSIVHSKYFGETSSNERKVLISCHYNKPIKFTDFDETKIDTFKIDKSKDTILITSNNNIITINQYSLIPQKSDSLYLFVSEYLTKKSFLTNNLNTTSGQNLLISDGMMKISAIGTSGDSVIFSRNIQIQMLKSDKDKKMDLYYSSILPNSTYDWQIPSSRRIGGRGGASHTKFASIKISY